MTKSSDNPSAPKRGDVFAIRFDQRIKYMADLAARKERRSLTNFVEWAMERALRDIDLFSDNHGHTVKAGAAAKLLWDIQPAERLKKLHQHCPELLTYEEQHVLSVINDFRTAGHPGIGFFNGQEINWSLVKSCWGELKAYVSDPTSEPALGKALHEHANPMSRDA